MKRAIAAIVLSVAILLTGCSQTTASNEISEPSSGATLSVDDGMFTSRDMEIGYDESTCVHIELNGDAVSCDSILPLGISSTGEGNRTSSQRPTGISFSGIGKSPRRQIGF